MRIGKGLVMGAAALTLWSAGAHAAVRKAAKPHNVILFVADGLRSGIVTPQTAPALAALRDEGVDFHNSHSLYPTVTTANASAIATGHYLGDTGDFGNTLYVGPGRLPKPADSIIAKMEDDAVLGLLDERYAGDYLVEESLLAAARRQGFATAAIGKLGPIAIQDITQRNGEGTIVIDDSTGKPAPDGLPVATDVITAIKAAGLSPVAPGRGDNGVFGTKVANIAQIAWFADVTTQVVLPRFKASGRPFAMVFWSRDPDGSQHNQGDSPGQLSPGINGPTSMAAIRNASDTLQKLRDALKALGLDKTTDIVITADHGFSTVSKQSQTSPSARLIYRDTPPGTLPQGFVGIDLSLALDLPLWNGDGKPLSPKAGEHPAGAAPGGAALLGPDPAQPLIVVGNNGGSDLIYLLGPDPKALATRIAPLLAAQDYTGALFVNDDLGPIPGALPMSALNLMGTSRLPRPSIFLSFASHAGDCAVPENCQIDIIDDAYQQGQGSHGSFGRGDTHNFMAAIGPDFKTRFRDPAPVSNADLVPTIAKALGIRLRPKGKLTGRVASESLKGGAATSSVSRVMRSEPAADGFHTVLNYQEAGGARYFDAAGMPGRVLGLKP
jgi:arylsulfatase A-like enzyme